MLNYIRASRAWSSRLYDMIKKDGLKDPYTGKPAINFLDRNSFVQKLHGHAQEFQMAVIIVKEFFIKHIKHHKDDVEYWLKEIFQSCQKCKDLVIFFNNIFSLFPKGDDPKLVRELLKHPNSMRDEACRQANAIDHKIQYSELVEAGLQTIKRKMFVGTMPMPTNHLLFAHACSRDWDHDARTDEQKHLIPSSTIQLQQKAKSGDK